jgi:tetraprenyl-beta-curcumene synthase
MINAAPSTPSQILTLIAVAVRELTWVLPAVNRDVREWHQRATAMPLGPLRSAALTTLASERFNLEGAALFAALPQRRNPDLLRLLVALEVIWDYLDTVSEHPFSDTVRNGLQLHRAIVEAVDPSTPMSDYYRFSPEGWTDDGGYLRSLVETCRALCVRLPSYTRVQPLLSKVAAQAQVGALNHEPHPTVRDVELEVWARREFPEPCEAEWFELTASAASSLTVHALLALAADPTCTQSDVDATYAVYFPWVSLQSTMLDSFADLADDRASGAHSYISHYPDFETAVDRICHVVSRATHLALQLPRGERHVLIPTGMTAMYLSHPNTTTSDMRQPRRQILNASGQTHRVLLLVLNIWRAANSLASQRSRSSRRRPPNAS